MVTLVSGEIYGTPVLLVTRVVITALQGSFGFVAMIVAIYYSGELVWRDRDRKVHELIDASATPDWTFLVPKTLALILVLASILLVGVVAGIGIQTFKGYFDFEIDKYLLWYVLPGTIRFAMTAVLAIVVQSLSPNKFVGWAIMVVYLISTIVLSNMGFDHVLYRYGSGVGMPQSDMNGRATPGNSPCGPTAYWAAGRDPPAGAGLRPVAARDRDPLPAAPPAPAAPAEGTRRRHRRPWRWRLHGSGRLHLRQHQRLEHLPELKRRGEAVGQVREDTAALRDHAPADHRRRQAGPRPASPCAATGDPRLLCDPEQHRRAAGRNAPALERRSGDEGPDRSGRADGARVEGVRVPHLSLRRADAAGRAPHRQLRHRAGAARLQERRQHHPDRRQRDLREQHGVRADRRHEPLGRPAERPRQAPQIRPAARAPSGQA
jgi:hypothetical protein